MTDVGSTVSNAAALPIDPSAPSPTTTPPVWPEAPASDVAANEGLDTPVDPTAPVDVEPATATDTEPEPPSEPSPPTGDPGSTPDLSPLPPVEGVSAAPDAEPVQSTPPEVAVDPAPVVDGPVQQRTFHDTREVAAAEAAGLPTPAGVPLQPAALAVLRELDQSITAMEGWVTHFRQTLDKVMRL